MTEKKTEVITFRTEKWVKDILSESADYNKWSIAQLVNQICINNILNPYPGQITIKLSELIKVVDELKEEAKGKEKGIRIQIEYPYAEDNEQTEKEIYFSMLECGGLGQTDGFDSIRNMSNEEIQRIP